MSLNNVQQQEAALVQILKDAAARLASVGTTDLAAALQDLRQAADAAKSRLDAAAGKARAVFATLATDAASISTSLSGDLFGEAKSEVTADPKSEVATSDVAAPQQPAEQVVTVAACSPVEAPARQWPEAPLTDDDDKDEKQLPHPADPTPPAAPDADDDVDELAGDGWTQTDLIGAPAVTVAANAPINNNPGNGDAPPQGPPATRQKPATARKPAARTKRPRDA